MTNNELLAIAKTRILEAKGRTRTRTIHLMMFKLAATPVAAMDAAIVLQRLELPISYNAEWMKMKNLATDLVGLA